MSDARSATTPASTTRGRLDYIKWAFLIIGSIGLIVAFRSARDRAESVDLPTWSTLLVSGVFCVLGLTTLGLAWSVALDGRGSRLSLLHGFAVSQLGKYIPGGVWQPAGQVAFATGGALGLSQLWSRFAGFSLAMAAGAGVAAGLLVVAPEVPLPMRLLGAAAGTTVVLTIPPATRLLERILSLIVRRTVPSLMPTPGRLAEVGLSMAGLFAYSLGFAVVMAAAEPQVPVLTAAAAFALAWLIGFIAIPVPAGVGIREAVLVACLTDLSSGSQVIAASVAYRAVSIVGEALLCVVTSASVVRRRRTSADARA